MTAPDDTMRAWEAEVEATAARLSQWAIDGCPGGTGGALIHLDRVPGERDDDDWDPRGEMADAESARVYGR